jgi:Flp pilus assembly protein TadG
MTLRDESGSVVAEFAVAMPAVMLVLALQLGGIQLAGLQLRAQDAAADAARSWARGESGSVVAGHLARQLPSARVTRFSRGDLVCATVRVSGAGPSARLGVAVAATACALSGGR